jgi:FixJ family two-component response regulator
MIGPTATVHVVDDDAAFRVAISRMLTLAGLQVRQHASGGAFLLADIDLGAPACVLLDVSMPGPSGIELYETLASRGQSLPVIFLTGVGDIPGSVRAMKAGAVDYLTKPVERDVLLAAIGSALERQRQRSERADSDRTLSERYATLSGRERAVLRRVVAGRLNKQIADELGIAERTVKVHRARAMDKLGAASLAELVRIAVQLPEGPAAP